MELLSYLSSPRLASSLALLQLLEIAGGRSSARTISAIDISREHIDLICVRVAISVAVSSMSTCETAETDGCQSLRQRWR